MRCLLGIPNGSINPRQEHSRIRPLIVPPTISNTTSQSLINIMFRTRNPFIPKQTFSFLLCKIIQFFKMKQTKKSQIHPGEIKKSGPPMRAAQTKNKNTEITNYRRAPVSRPGPAKDYSTVTDLAKFRGWSTLRLLFLAM